MIAVKFKLLSLYTTQTKQKKDDNASKMWSVISSPPPPHPPHQAKQNDNKKHNKHVTHNETLNFSKIHKPHPIVWFYKTGSLCPVLVL